MQMKFCFIIHDLKKRENNVKNIIKDLQSFLCGKIAIE